MRQLSTETEANPSHYRGSFIQPTWPSPNSPQSAHVREDSGPVPAQQMTQDQLLRRMDRQGAIIQCCILLTAMINYLVNYVRQKGCLWVCFWVSMDACMAMLQYGLASVSTFYKLHRTISIIIVQSLKLFIAMKYVPAAFAVSMPVQLAAGKQVAVACNALMYGLASFQIAYEIVISRIALRSAFPFAVFKLALSTYVLMPSHIAAIQVPEVTAVTAAIKQRVDDFYYMLLSAITAPRLYSTSTGLSCPGMSLSVWCHLCLGGLLPLYYLAAVEGCLPGCRPSSSSSSSSSRESSRSSDEFMFSSTARDSAGPEAQWRSDMASSSSSAAAAVAADPYGRCHRAEDEQRQQQQRQQQQLSGSALSAGIAEFNVGAFLESSHNSSSSSSSYYSFLYHLLVLLGSSMLLWAAVDAVISTEAVIGVLQIKGFCV